MNICIAVLLLLMGQAAQGAIQPVQVSPQQPWNLKGNTLVLDVGSLSFQGNHPMGPPIGSANGCADYCDKTAGCTGWTFCNKKEGCGSGCDVYVKSNPNLKVEEGENPTLPSPSWYALTAIKGFGLWGPTGGCARNCGFGTDGSYSCKDTGRWPHGMCSLKQATKEDYWSRNGGEGWVSGFIQLPTECKGLSARACRRCLSSKNPTACLSCAKNAAIKPSLLENVKGGYYAMYGPDGCGTCYNSSAPDKCTACLFNKQPCAACALQPDNPSNPGEKMDASSCINCVNTYGGSFSQACISCGLLGASASHVQKCMGCVQRASKVACAAATAWPPACWSPGLHGTSCATCVTSAKDYETCVKCIEQKPFTESCMGCATFNDAAKQASCYACAKASNSAYSSCTDCFTYLKDEQALKQCVACITSSKTTAGGKQWCWGCQNWCSTYESRAKCSQCLAGQHDNYMQACSCSSK